MMNFQHTGLKFILLKVVLLVPFYFFLLWLLENFKLLMWLAFFLLDNTKGFDYMQMD